MAVITGNNVSVLVYDSGDWKHYGCALSCSLNVETSTIETSTTGSGEWATFMPQKHSGSGTISGLVNLDSGSSLLNLADLRAKQIAKTRLHIAFEREDALGNVYVDAFYAYITNSSDTGELNSVASFTIDFIVDGEITQTFTNVS